MSLPKCPTVHHNQDNHSHNRNNKNHHHQSHNRDSRQGVQTSTTTTTTPCLLNLPLFFLPRHHLLHTLVLVLSIVTTPSLVFQPVQGKSVSTTTKSSSCTYTVVINEFDASKCSSMNPYVQADGTGMETAEVPTSHSHHKPPLSRGMMKDRSYYNKPSPPSAAFSSAASSASSTSSSNVKSQLENVENALLEEKVKSREINTTLNRHASMLASAQRTLEAYKANFTHVFRAMVNMERRLHHQRRINRSLNKKLSNVILDVVEVNNVLTRKIPKGSAKKTLAKSFQVESVGKVRSCVGITDSNKVYKDCTDVYDSGHHRSDVYYIKPLYSACPIPVWCDMDSPKAGWLLIQRRQDGSVDFNRKWDAYRDGFGDVIGEHWLGNDNIFLLTNQARYQLRIDLWDFSGNRVFALYSNFKIEGERDHYRLHVSGFSGSAKDSLMRHNNKQFSTEDRDHDNRRDASCDSEWEAGWWFDKCWYALLNGPYQNQSDVRYKGIAWKSWKFEQLRGAEMKIRPIHNKRR